MSDIASWPTNPAGFPLFLEGMNKSQVNDDGRELGAAVAAWYQSPEWHNYAYGFSLTRLNDTQLQVDDEDVEAMYPVGSRIRVVGDTTEDGFVSAIVFSTHTTVTIVFDGAAVTPTNPVTFWRTAGATQGEAAYRDVGTGAEELPRNDDLGELAYLDEGEGDVDTVDELHASEIADEGAALRNLLVNGDFARWQEGATWASPDNNDDIYFADQWVLLSEVDDAVDVAQETTQLPADCLSGVEFTWQTADKKAGIYQVVKHMDCASILGGSKKASLIGRVEGDAAAGYPAKIRFLVLSWTGTADIPTSDWISSWPSAGADPSPKAGFTIEGSDELVLDGTWQTFSLEDIAIDAAFAKNVGIFIWSDDDTISAAQILRLARIRLVPGSRASDLEPEQTVELKARTDLFFCKTFDEDTAPADGAETASALHAQCNSVGDCSVVWNFPVRMHKIPSMSFFNPDTASPSGKYWREFSGTPNDRAVSASYVGEARCSIYCTTMAGGSSQGRIQAVANARFF